jgi:exopolyphosphatase / guanosine-5'-triphosphate,3'-diphosphate pyrophosphatase
MRFALIDCGTNTFHLLIVERKTDGSIIKLFATKAAVKLGAGGILKNRIETKPFIRGIKALTVFRKYLDKYQVNKLVAFGTAALRSAKNGNEFISEAWKRCRIKIELISGAREAALIYQGVTLAMKPGEGVSLIIDIGGGSTEFILCDEKKILWKKSFPLGAALLLEMFPPSDPISKDEISKINAHYTKMLQPLFQACRRIPPQRLIGSSGSFDTFAEMIVANSATPDILEGKTSYKFKLRDYNAIHRVLVASTTAERMNMKGLVKMRVDMIVMATLQLTFVLKNLKLRNMYLSTYALKEGMLKELVG